MLLSIWLVPPALNIAIIATGFIVSRWYFRVGAFISVFGLLSLWALSTAYVSSVLHRSIELHPVFDTTTVDQSDAQAIVMVGASHYDLAKEYGVSTPTEDGLARLHYAAHLHNETALPILLTGGPTNARQDIHSEVLAGSLRNQFRIEAKWLERRSSTTWQNASFSAEILHPEGIKKVLLVTQSYHMQRAVNLFELAGFIVIPAPTQVSASFPWNDWRSWMPQIIWLELSSLIFHEYIGIAWHQLVPPVGSTYENNLKHYDTK